MLTLKEVKDGLKEVRYYYAKQKDFDTAAKAIGRSRIVDLVDKYNNAVRNAPAQLYDIYVSLYVNNNTQVVVSYDWDVTPDYIKQINRQLCEFLRKELDIDNEDKGGEKDDKRDNA